MKDLFTFIANKYFEPKDTAFIKIVNKNNRRYYLENYLLSIIVNHQLNTKKNKIKPPLESEHPLQLIQHASVELTEIQNEFNHENKIDYNRIFEEIGDVAGFLVGIIKWVIDDYINDKNKD